MHAARPAVAIAAAAIVVGVVGARDAAAHPLGPPPTAVVRAAGRDVIVEWRAAPDDAIAVGEHLGVLAAGSTAAFQDGAAQVAPPAADEAALAASPALRDYLVDHIAVTQRATACAAEVAPITDFVRDGARVVATCPDPVTSVEVAISMLTDVNDAYRTFAVGRETAPAQTVYTVDNPRQTWRFGVAASAGAGRLPALVAFAAVLVAGGGVVAWRRRGATPAADDGATAP